MKCFFLTACVSFELCICECMFEAFRALQCMAFDAIFGIHSMLGFPEQFSVHVPL